MPARCTSTGCWGLRASECSPRSRPTARAWTSRPSGPTTRFPRGATPSTPRQRPSYRTDAGAVTADAFAASTLPEGRIIVNTDALGADPRALAALIAHEATHMHHWADGTYPGLVTEFGREEGCAREETEGALIEQRVWSA